MSNLHPTFSNLFNFLSNAIRPYPDFFNTNKESGETLAESKAKCNKQEENILKIFKYRNEYGFLCNISPEEVQKLYAEEHAPIPLTSVRRALTCLTKKGYLQKTDEMVKGNYGKKVHTWQLTR